MMILRKIKRMIELNHRLYRIVRPVYRALHSKTVLRQRLLRRSPSDFNFEITTKCNSLCAYCPREEVVKKNMRSVDDMDGLLVEKTIDGFAALSGMGVQISPDGLGEPFMASRAFEIISLIRARIPGAHIHANTNAINLNDELADKIIGSELDSLIVSINSWDRDVYQKINGVDVLDQVAENAKNFLVRKGNKSPAVSIQILDIDANKKDIAAFYQYWKPLLNQNDTIYLRPFNDFGGSIRYGDFKEAPLHIRRFPCFALFNTLMVDKDGYIFPCCMGLAHGKESDICLGNIRDITLKDVVAGEKIRALQKLHKNNQYDQITACHNCNSWAVMPNVFFACGKRWI